MPEFSASPKILSMRWIFLLSLFLQVSCATKYIIPGNRFMTPESQGGVFRSSVEFQQSTANQLTVNVMNASIEDGVLHSLTDRTGYAFSTSFLEQLDLFWTHTGGANSLFGGKFQFLGSSKTAVGAGHKMALSAAVGGNEHETEGANKVEFELSGSEFQLLYGYRFNEFLLTYSNLAYAHYNFAGQITSSDPSLNGLRPAYDTKVLSLYGGAEISFGAVFGKAECGYQVLKTTDTKNIANFIFGYALGVNW